MTVDDNAVKVLYIIGPSRTGSTVLENLIGETSTFFPAGEVRFTWERLLQNQWCGCRRPVAQCEFWTEVFRIAFSNSRFEGVQPEEVIRWQRQALHIHHTWRLLHGGPRRQRQRRALESHSAMMVRLYGAIAEVTGSPVIIDSSKRPASGAALLCLPGIEAYFVHLVRDPRAVVYSNLQEKAYPDGRPMPSKGVMFSIVYWLATNIAATAVCRRHGRARSLFVRYEDYIVEPDPTLERIRAMVDQAGPSSRVTSGEGTGPRPNHMISGNPSRFRDGPVELRRDDRWVADLSTRQRLLTTALTLPLLLRYGYPIRVKSESRSGA